MQVIKSKSLFGERADNFVEENNAGKAPPPNIAPCPIKGHIVTEGEQLDIDTFQFGALTGKAKVEPVASIVLMQ